ncbi:hypothetical protein CAEBREN_17905 [Caenorhabditis brenneri]|uniref:Dynein heavy chain coiled coil stalk domain-containing protein n=1 Tax=Caenorhabditis brenneri TaxID=135651 RepID=G0ML53_CAEBE|nr:hypothetical protein CAEBREN_17905 [Caenorhabditis brenneri]
MNKERNVKSARIEKLADLISVKTKNLETMRAGENALKTAVDSMISTPQEEFRRCVEELLKFSNADIKSLSKITKPSVGIRLCCEMLRTIFEPNFKPKRHAAETWQESIRFVSDKSFFIKLATCDADILTVDQMKVLKKYVERAEFNANKIEHESAVCACLCKWISSFLELACTLRVMEEQVEESKELREQIRQTEEKYENESSEMQQLKNDVEKISISMCTSHLSSLSVQFDSSVATSSNVINRIIRNLKVSRRFCLFQCSNESLLLNIRSTLPGATYFDMSQMTWKDPQMMLSLPKHVYSIVPTVFYNITEVPPPEMYEVLMKSEEKEVCYHNKSLELPDDILFVFVAKTLGHIPDQIRKLMEVITITTHLDPIEDAEKTERNELSSLLGEFTAADILESRDLTRRAMQLSTAP